MKSSSLEIHPEGDRTLLFSGAWTQLQLKLSLNQLWVTSKPGLAHPEGGVGGTQGGQCGVVSAWTILGAPVPGQTPPKPGIRVLLGKKRQEKWRSGLEIHGWEKQRCDRS